MLDNLPELGLDFGEGELRWWIKIVGMLQQNWALPLRDGDNVTVFFVDDASGVFDQLAFGTEDEMAEALERNGFAEFASTPPLQEFLHSPGFPLHEVEHINGPIYSSGQFWQS